MVSTKAVADPLFPLQFAFCVYTVTSKAATVSVIEKTINEKIGRMIMVAGFELGRNVIQYRCLKVCLHCRPNFAAWHESFSHR